MLFRHLFKKPLVLAAYVALMVLTPILAARTTYQLAMLIEYVRQLDAGRFTAGLIQALVSFGLYTVSHFGLVVCQKAMISQGRVGVKAELFRHVTGLGRDAFAKRGCAEYITAFSNDISLLEYRYFAALLDGAEALVSFATYFAAILTVNAAFAAVVLAFESLGVTICLIFRRRNARLSKTYISLLGAFTGRVRECFAARLAIHNYGAVGSVEAEFGRANARAEDAKTDMEESLVFTDALAHFTRCMGAYTIVALGAVLMAAGRVAFSEVFVAYTFSNTLSAPIKKIINDINAICSVRPIRANMERMTSESDQERALKQPEESYSGIALEHVSVRLGERTVLRDVTCCFEPGKKYLIVGSNGCGKSTLARLLVRGNDHYEGSVVLCGREMRELPNTAIQAHVSLISEDVAILTDTVRSNIALYRDVPEEKLREAAAYAGVKVPLERRLRAGGRNISSGERRRVEIARSLIQRPDALIVDEAFSTLDIPTARALEEKLLALEDQTVVAIAHNFAADLLERYDGILLMEDGAIVASGKHRQLMAGCEPYRHLIELKCGSVER